jgi:hypothetical protein
MLARANSAMDPYIMVFGIMSQKDKESFDDLHHYLVKDAEQQSERDFPHMSI